MKRKRGIDSDETLRLMESYTQTLAEMMDNDGIVFRNILDEMEEKKLPIGCLNVDKLICPKTGISFLSWIAKYNHGSIFKRLLEEGCEIQFTYSIVNADKDGKLLIYYALVFEPKNSEDFQENNYILQNLIQFANYTDLKPDTSQPHLSFVYLAYKTKKRDIVKLLVEQGCCYSDLPTGETEKINNRIEETIKKLLPTPSKKLKLRLNC